MPEEKSAKVLEISPLIPMKIVLEIDGDKTETIVFLDQTQERIYTAEGPIDEKFQEAVFNWIEQKNKEIERRMSLQGRPTMPNDINQMSKKIIIP